MVISMTATIRVLDTKVAAKAEVVEEAKRVLDLAESGAITDLSWAASCLDGSMKSSFTATQDQSRRLASVSRLLHRLHMSAHENDE